MNDEKNLNPEPEEIVSIFDVPEETRPHSDLPETDLLSEMLPETESETLPDISAEETEELWEGIELDTEPLTPLPAEEEPELLPVLTPDVLQSVSPEEVSEVLPEEPSIAQAEALPAEVEEAAAPSAADVALAASLIPEPDMALDEVTIPGEASETDAPSEVLPEGIPVEEPIASAEDSLSGTEEAELIGTEETVLIDTADADLIVAEEPREAPAEPAFVLEEPIQEAEILADETAMFGFARHGDTELEQILQEAAEEEQKEKETEKEEIKPMELKHKETKPARRKQKPVRQRQDRVWDEDKYEEEPERKRRPAMKKGYGFLGIPHILVTGVWLAIILLIGVTLGRMAWIGVSEVLAFGKPDHSITVSISDGDNIDTVTAKLKAAGLIQYPELFKKYAELTKADEDISAGTFTLSTRYDYFALVKAMSYHSPARETIDLVIPEGYTCAQIFALLEENNVCTVAELEAYAANGEIKERWFLEGLVRGDKYCLEGYLFPDTYEFYTNDEPGRVLGKFLDNFDNRFTDLMKSRIETLNERMAAVLRNRGYEEAIIEERKFTIRDIIIIASMIEKETANDAESYDISSVIYNRLTNPANYPYLNIDAALIYALGGNIDPETGKTKPLTNEDLQMDHPYNTYTVKGMIPGPISNPGRNSLNAALDPTETDYYYYVYNPKTATSLFAKNDKEHKKNVDYVRSLGG